MLVQQGHVSMALRVHQLVQAALTHARVLVATQEQTAKYVIVIYSNFFLNTYQ